MSGEELGAVGAAEGAPDDVSPVEDGTFFVCQYEITERWGDTNEEFRVTDNGADGVEIRQGERSISMGREASRMLRNVLNRILAEGRA